MIDGTIAFTNTPSADSSAAAPWVIATTAAFDAAYATRPAVGTSAGRETVFS